MTPLEDYLARYSEPEASLASHVPCRFDLAVALPLLGEDASVDALLTSLGSAARHVGKTTLAILVVNAREDHPAPHRAANASLWHRLEAKTHSLPAPHSARFGQFSTELGVLLLDRFRGAHALGPREGVGHARKIGCDLALALHAAGKIVSPYFSTTDGDATVAPDYFAWREEKQDAAIVHPFQHDVKDASAFSLLLYEISLRYYVLGLQAARSPYAFHTIGSTLTVHARAYAAVRGFPKREAAEDFYLLSKLAKVGRIRTDGGEVRLAARASDRVPFGTGRSMSKIQSDLAEGKTYQLYHPTGFAWLAEWLEAAESVMQGEALSRAKTRMAERSSATAAALIEETGGWEALEIALRTRKTAEDRRRHFHDWFDGFRTLKFLHGARDRELGTLGYEVALASAPFLGKKNGDATFWLKALRELEASSPSFSR